MRWLKTRPPHTPREANGREERWARGVGKGLSAPASAGQVVAADPMAARSLPPFGVRQLALLASVLPDFEQARAA